MRRAITGSSLLFADHVLGRPSIRFRKYQVFTVVLIWSILLCKGDRHGPRPFRLISEYFTKRLTTWRTLVIFCLSLYVSRNFGRVVGLESPEPLADLYSRAYFRATWVTTALDAGFWTAMRLRPKWLKDFASVIFTLYYLVCAEQADEMVRRVRGKITIDHLRVSWDKPNTPYIRAFTRLTRPSHMQYAPRKIRITRPEGSRYEGTITAWLYFNAPTKELEKYDQLVLDIPGGGFVAMDPRCHDDKLMAWAGGLGIPVVALDYGKAPEHHYPYALHECFDAYKSLATKPGGGLGLATSSRLKIVLSGDSAGGNLAVGLISMILSDSPHSSYTPGNTSSNVPLRPPEALILVYPALDMNVSSWLTDEQMALLADPEWEEANRNVLKRKSEDYRRLTLGDAEGPHNHDRPPSPSTAPSPRPVSAKSGMWLADEPTMQSPVDEGAKGPNKGPAHSKSTASNGKRHATAEPRHRQIRLAMHSILSYVNDRILSPQMLRSMILLYVGEENKPDFATDHLLSPILTPEHILARFPKTYILVGERDPLVDNSNIFAGRLRQAHLQRFRERQELGLISSSERFDKTNFVELEHIPGVSHGFLQFVSVFPEGWEYIHRCRRWMRQAFNEADAREVETPAEERRRDDYFAKAERHHKRRSSGSDSEDLPLEMGILSMTPMSGVRKKSSARPASGRRQAMRRPISGSNSPIATRSKTDLSGNAGELLLQRMADLNNGLRSDSKIPHTP